MPAESAPTLDTPPTARRWRGPGARRPARRGPRALLAILAAAAAGCAASEPMPSLPLESAPPFTGGGEARRLERWWTAFDDEQLDHHVELALGGSFSLASAWERIAEARAVARREGAALRPQLDGLGGVARSEDDEGVQLTKVALGLAASYEVDLWGRIRDGAEAERLRADAAASDYRAAAVSLSAQVALTWYQLAEARLQLALIATQITTNGDVLGVLETRFGVGQSGSADVLRQRQLVEATREQQVVQRARIEVLEHLLAVLQGRAPQALDEVRSERLPDVPPLPDTGLPAELLARRPDVRAAHRRLAAADRDVAAAVADRYPRLDLTASVTTAAEDVGGLFEGWLANLAADLVGPLVDGGRRRAEVDRASAARRRRLAEYGQALLVAFQDVEDTLALESYQVERIRILEGRLSLAVSTFEQLRSQYILGAADFIDVVTALRDQQALERDLITARLERVSQRIALYRALAGGFATPADDAESAQPGAANGDPGGTPKRG